MMKIPNLNLKRKPNPGSNQTSLHGRLDKAISRIDAAIANMQAFNGSLNREDKPPNGATGDVEFEVPKKKPLPA